MNLCEVVEVLEKERDNIDKDDVNSLKRLEAYNIAINVLSYISEVSGS